MKQSKHPIRNSGGESIRPCDQPKRYKQALLTFIGLLAPVYYVPPAVIATIPGPRLLAVCAAVAIIVTLMTYIVMPVLKFLTAKWLCEQTGVIGTRDGH